MAEKSRNTNRPQWSVCWAHANASRRSSCSASKSWTDGLGAPVVFRIRELSYDEVREIQQMHAEQRHIARGGIITAGVVEPNLRDERLQKRCGAATPYEVGRTDAPCAGEIEDLQVAIEKLSGYRGSTLRFWRISKKN